MAFKRSAVRSRLSPPKARSDICQDGLFALLQEIPQSSIGASNRAGRATSDRGPPLRLIFFLSLFRQRIAPGFLRAGHLAGYAQKMSWRGRGDGCTCTGPRSPRVRPRPDRASCQKLGGDRANMMRTGASAGLTHACSAPAGIRTLSSLWS